MRWKSWGWRWLYWLWLRLLLVEQQWGRVYLPAMPLCLWRMFDSRFELLIVQHRLYIEKWGLYKIPWRLSWPLSDLLRYPYVLFALCRWESLFDMFSPLLSWPNHLAVRTWVSWQLLWRSYHKDLSKLCSWLSSMFIIPNNVHCLLRRFLYVVQIRRLWGMCVRLWGRILWKQKFRSNYLRSV